MHILFLTHYFPPEVNAPASRTFENAKRWVGKGHRVTVITCAPNHPAGILYAGYKNRLVQWDRIEGIDVLRVITFISPNEGFLKRTINYFSYMLSATFFCLLVKKVDVVLSTSPQFFCGMAGLLVSKIKRRPWVLEIRDLWPESILTVGAVKNRLVIGILKKIERFLYCSAHHVIAVTHSFKRHITAVGIPADRISVLTNGADLERFKPGQSNDLRASLSLEGKFVASYIGTHGMAHHLETVLEAARLVDRKSQVCFLLVGDGAERQNLLRQKETSQLSNVIMLPQQPKELIPEYLSLSDACIVLLKKSELFKTVIPSKIFEAMAMERPVILGVEGESEEIIRQAECGICIEPENAKALANAVLMLHRDRELSRKLGENGRKCVAQYYDRDVLAERYLHILSTCGGT